MSEPISVVKFRPLDDHEVFDTTVVIPTHPGRGEMGDPESLLGRAVRSVTRQTHWPRGGIAIARDLQGDGAGQTRKRALTAALERGTEFVSFLDSDDTWYPNHLEVQRRLVEHGIDGNGADVAYSWFDGNEPFNMHRGKVFNPADPHHLTMTLTVRSSLAREIVAAFDIEPMHEEWSGEDWEFILRLRDAGARFAGTGEVTWTYWVHPGNTSGLPTKGDALQAGV